MADAYATKEMSLFCGTCARNGVPDHGNTIITMELVGIKEHDFEHSTHTYEGRCPTCGTLHRYNSYREEINYSFEEER